MTKKNQRLSIQIEKIIRFLFEPVIQRRETEKTIEILRYRRLVDVSAIEFERAVGELFRKSGFEVIHSGQTGDGGVDLTLTKNKLNYIAQCKRYTHAPIGEPVVRDLYGALVHQRADHGYLIATTRFTAPANEFAKNKPITLIDSDGLKKWLTSIDEAEAKRKQLASSRPVSKNKNGNGLIALLVILAVISCFVILPMLITVFFN